MGPLRSLVAAIREKADAVALLSPLDDRYVREHRASPAPVSAGADGPHDGSGRSEVGCDRIAAQQSGLPASGGYR